MKGKFLTKNYKEDGDPNLLLLQVGQKEIRKLSIYFSVYVSFRIHLQFCEILSILTSLLFIPSRSPYCPISAIFKMTPKHQIRKFNKINLNLILRITTCGWKHIAAFASMRNIPNNKSIILYTRSILSTLMKLDKTNIFG